MAFQFYNAGYPGDNTQKLLARLERDVLRLGPTLVILQCGTNDAINPRAIVPEEEFRRNVTALVEKVLEKKSEILLIAPPPCLEGEVREKYDFPLAPGEEEGGLNEALSRYGKIMGEAAKAYRLPILDLFLLFSARGKVGDSPESLIRNLANSRTKDGAHPTIEGHKLISKMLYGLLMAEGMDPTLTVFLGDSITSGYPFPGMGSMEGENFPTFTAQKLNGE